jgi:hypothetical protein
MIYHILLGRDFSHAPWCMYFGAYDRSEVVAEKQAFHDQSGLAIHTLSSDLESDIQSFIARWNRMEGLA